MIQIIGVRKDFRHDIEEFLKQYFRPQEILFCSKTENDIIKNKIVMTIETNMTDMLVKVVVTCNYNNKSLSASEEADFSSEDFIVKESPNLSSEQKSESVLEDDSLEILGYLQINMRKAIKRMIRRCIFRIMSKVKNAEPAWGILTGIRPTKIVHKMKALGKSKNEIFTHLNKQLYISKKKALLLIDVVEKEEKFIYPIEANKVSVYISIPFCPTKCSYCSFPSNAAKNNDQVIDDYVKKLFYEMQEISYVMRDKKIEVESIYIGGGTPTVLTASSLNCLLKKTRQLFEFGKVKEFTVEAGRPDTIDREKLIVLKENGVSRISINPQTMNDVTLKKIGRNHTVESFIKAYKEAMSVGFDNINIDLIVGLPDESCDMVEHTMKEITKLKPKSLTIHTLAIKRASSMNCSKNFEINSDSREIEKMLDTAKDYARALDLKPYYLYRQKQIGGNLENVGYSLEGYECLYNMKIIEEVQTIIAFGAGAVSKFVQFQKNSILRVPNMKNVADYINRTDELIERKRKIINSTSTNKTENRPLSHRKQDREPSPVSPSPVSPCLKVGGGMFSIFD
ncbi:MAG: coproporphyrinogen dehydrogenase HemZ [Alkaliphilus sp.]